MALPTKQVRSHWVVTSDVATCGGHVAGGAVEGKATKRTWLGRGWGARLGRG